MNVSLEMLKTKFLTADEAFRARELRERAMLAGMVAAVVFFAIDSMTIQPLATKQSLIASSIESARKEIAKRDEEIAQLSRSDLSPEERRIADETSQVRQQLEQIESQMATEISELVPPEAIVSVLEELLAEGPDLHLVRLESQPPHRLGASDAVEAANAANAEGIPVKAIGGLYRHGVRIEIEGSFAATLDYLERVESSHWHLLWDRLEYRVKKFPTATVTIDFHTISEAEEWIGV